jgi:hypothetical protein
MLCYELRKRQKLFLSMALYHKTLRVSSPIIAFSRGDADSRKMIGDLSLSLEPSVKTKQDAPKWQANDILERGAPRSGVP